MIVDEGLRELAAMSYPGKVDVVQQVMDEVSKRPYLRPAKKAVQPWQRLVATTAAAAVVAIVVNVVMVRTNNCDEAGIGEMITQVQNYDYYGYTVEDFAADPMEYLYAYED